MTTGTVSPDVLNLRGSATGEGERMSSGPGDILQLIRRDLANTRQTSRP